MTYYEQMATPRPGGGDGRMWFSLPRGARIRLGAAVFVQHDGVEPVVLGRITGGMVADDRVVFAIRLEPDVRIEGGAA